MNKQQAQAISYFTSDHVVIWPDPEGWDLMHLRLVYLSAMLKWRTHLLPV